MKKLKKLIPLLGVLPFAFGVIGYRMEGETITDSLYGSFALYQVSPVSDGYNIWIEIARWTAPLVLATALLCLLQRIRDRLKWWLESFFSKSVAVYCDTDMHMDFDGNTHVIYPKDTLTARAKSQIILFQSDEDSLDFYEKYKGKLEKRKVYIGLRELEYGLLKDQNPNVSFYDINGTIARLLWKEIGIWKNTTDRTIKISILGDGNLGQAILNTGLLLNLYSLTQNITYNFIGDTHYYQTAHGTIKTCNQDRVCYYGMKDANVLQEIETSDYVIISEESTIEQLQTIGVLGMDKQVYYYAPKDGDAGVYLKFPNLKPFGRNHAIYTDENIRRESLVEAAKQLNYKYAKEYNQNVGTAEEEWRKLDGFLKWSNISAADFNEVLKDISENNNLDNMRENIEKLAELEHIHWCRFHYLNYWKYGIPENGKAKDVEKRIHTCLCDYSDLSEENKEKDRDVVRQACGW